MTDYEAIEILENYVDTNGLDTVLSLVIKQLCGMKYLPRNPYPFIIQHIMHIETGISMDHKNFDKAWTPPKIAGKGLFTSDDGKICGLPHVVSFVAPPSSEMPMAPVLQTQLLLSDLLDTSQTVRGEYRLTTVSALLGKEVYRGTFSHAVGGGVATIGKDYRVEGPNFEKAVSLFSDTVVKSTLALANSPFCMLVHFSITSKQEGKDAARMDSAEDSSSVQGHTWDATYMQENRANCISILNSATVQMKVLSSVIYVTARQGQCYLATGKEAQTKEQGQPQKKGGGGASDEEDDGEDDDDEEDSDESGSSDDSDVERRRQLIRRRNARLVTNDDGQVRELVRVRIIHTFHFVDSTAETPTAKHFSEFPFFSMLSGVFFDKKAVKVYNNLYLSAEVEKFVKNAFKVDLTSVHNASLIDASAHPISADFRAYHAKACIDAYLHGDTARMQSHCLELFLIDNEVNSHIKASLVELFKQAHSAVGFWRCLSSRVEVLTNAVLLCRAKYRANKLFLGSMERYGAGLLDQLQTALFAADQSIFEGLGARMLYLLDTVLIRYKNVTKFVIPVDAELQDWQVHMQEIATSCEAIAITVGKLMNSTTSAVQMRIKRLLEQEKVPEPVLPLHLKPDPLEIYTLMAGQYMRENSKVVPQSVTAEGVLAAYLIDTEVDLFVKDVFDKLFSGARTAGPGFSVKFVKAIVATIAAHSNNKQVVGSSSVSHSHFSGLTAHPYVFAVNLAKTFNMRFEAFDEADANVLGAVKRELAFISQHFGYEIYRVKTNAGKQGKLDLFGHSSIVGVADVAEVARLATGLPAIFLPTRNKKQTEELRMCTAFAGDIHTYRSFASELPVLVINHFFFVQGSSFETAPGTFADQVLYFLASAKKNSKHLLEGLYERTGDKEEGEELLVSGAQLAEKNLGSATLSRIAVAAGRRNPVMLKVLFLFHPNTGEGEEASKHEDDFHDSKYIPGRINFYLYFLNTKKNIVQPCVPPEEANTMMYRNVFLTMEDAFTFRLAFSDPEALASISKEAQEDLHGSPSSRLEHTRTYTVRLKTRALGHLRQGDVAEAYLSLMQLLLLRKEWGNVPGIYRMFHSLAGRLHGLVVQLQHMRAVLAHLAAHMFDLVRTEVDVVLNQFHELYDSCFELVIFNKTCVYVSGVKTKLVYLLNAVKERLETEEEKCYDQDLLEWLDEIETRLKIVARTACYFLHANNPGIQEEFESMVESSEMG
mmetsp:Transcript_23635/g.46548  ORF Transcript_23635/g.46548 Transcript_23635/m.46548 type:complete len:1222 (+) Transcript_23635:22-3687(+)